MVFLDKRINGICDEMKKYAVRQRVPVEEIYYKEGNFLRPRDAEADGTPFAPFDSQRMHWYGPDRHYCGDHRARELCGAEPVAACAHPD